MIKKLLLAVATLMATMSFAFAQVDVNQADAAALDSVKGIGPAKSKQIIEERGKGGQFKDWADFERRVKGIGAKNSVKLSQAGLQVNGQAKPGADAVPAAAAGKTAKAAMPNPVAPKADAKPIAVSAKADAKATPVAAKAMAPAAAAKAPKDEARK